MIILVKMWTIFIFKQYNLIEVSIVKKKIIWTVCISIFVLFSLFILYYAGSNLYVNLRILIMELKYQEINNLYGQYIFSLIFSILFLLECIMCLFFCIREYFKIWKLSPKELKEREENRLIKVEMEQRKEKELALLEIEKKKKEIEELEKKLN